MKTSKGKVYLVGAGPGDPGLITVKGLECIRNADVIIYDYLASPLLLEWASGNAEIIYVGKKGSSHTLPQDKIIALITEKAIKGLTVVRLKGGDPFIFGRGGEEAEDLINAGICFEVVPGVSSAIAAPAYAGIPLTHRRFASSVVFITGHEDPAKEESGVDWPALARGMGTTVFLMGVKNLPNIIKRLISHGMQADTPVALIQWGTTPKQLTVSGVLYNIVERVKAAGLESPAVIILGKVVKLRESIKWFENRPLSGKRIVVTRAREQASELIKLLAELGAECFECPTIKVIPPDDWTLLDRAIKNIASYDWLVFTSVNGVSIFFERLFHNQMDVRALGNLRTASIGPATGRKMFDFGLKSDISPNTYRAEAIVEAFASEDIRGKRILLPRAKEARPMLPAKLAAMGAEVDAIAAYHTEEVGDKADLLLSRLEEGTIDLITFTSSSTVKNFHALIPPEKFGHIMQGVTVAAIGPITADTAKKMAFDVHIVATSFTIPGLCDAILQHYKQQVRN